MSIIKMPHVYNLKMNGVPSIDLDFCSKTPNWLFTRLSTHALCSISNIMVTRLARATSPFRLDATQPNTMFNRPIKVP